VTEKAKKGFAAMSPEQRSAIASQGGKAAHQQGKAHQWTTQTAAAAGAKGGRASRGGRGKATA
jgi:general stress protein YciG